MQSSYAEILSEVQSILGAFVKDGRTIGEDTDLVNDLDLDSLKVMDLVTEAEDRFDISIPLNILPDVHTVRDFTRQVEKLLGGG